MDPETSEPSAATLAAELVTLLDVEEIDTDLYRGARQAGGEGRVFGGQVIAQALQAAQRSVDAPKTANSLHAYFMRPGDQERPIVFRVVRDFEGRSFSTRRVIAMQRGRPILNLACSFQVPEHGFAHQEPMPDVPPPESLRSDRELRAAAAQELPDRWRKHLLRSSPIEMRPVTPRSWTNPALADPHQASWFRLAAPIGDAGGERGPAIHRAVLAYASDMTLLGTAMLPHGLTFTSGTVQTASLDHALWFHEPFRAYEWLLYATDSPWAGHARGFNRGRIYARDGRLVASVAQEGLIRPRSGPPADQPF